MLKQQAKLVARSVYFFDIALVTAAFFVAFFTRDFALPYLFPSYFPDGLFPLSEYVKVFPLVLAIWTVLFFSHRSYNSHRTVPLRDEASDILRVVGLGTASLATLAYLVPFHQLSRLWFALFASFSAIFLILQKISLRLLARYVRSRGFNYRTILVVGTGRRARDVVKLVEEHTWWGYKIIGFVSDGHRLPAGWSRYPVVGQLSELKSILLNGIEGRRDGIDEVVIAVSREKLEANRSILTLCEDLGVRARIAMNIFPNRFARVELEELDGVPFVSFSTTPSNVSQLAAKRLIDVALSALLLVMSLPVLMVTALAIRFSSPGTVLFKQERIGLNGRIFTLYKFRTMIENAHQRRAELAHLNEMSGPVFKLKGDPRVTRVGRILRKFSLDELPQLWNVLKGDMSLVGPRPPIPEEVGLYERWQRRRLSMKPGLTCLWQVSGRNEVDFDRWMELDLHYIDNWSPTLDLKILLRTIPVVLLGKGAS
jgi:exopolysaccharide biosynthesis polyprenyl glycosylphosphotransferase